MVNTISIAFVTAALSATSSLAAPARAASRPKGSRTDQFGNVIAGLEVAANVAGTVVTATQPKREFLEAREPRRGGGKPKPPANRPHGSRTDQFGNVIAGLGVAADVANTVVTATQPKREFLEAREPRRGGGKPKPAVNRPHGSRTDQFGNVIAGLGVAADVANTVVTATQPKREFLETREPRRGGGKPKPAVNRPHGSRTDQFGNVIAGLGVAADVANTVVTATQPKREFLEVREPKRGGAKPRPAVNRPHGSRTDQFGNVIAGLEVAANVAGTVVAATQPPPPKREFLEVREPRRGGGKPKPAVNRPHGSRTDQFGNVIAGLGVAADVANTVVTATQPKREFLEVREPRRGGAKPKPAVNRPHGSRTDQFGNVIAGLGVAADVANTVVTATQPKREFIEDLIERDFYDWELEQLD